MTQFNTALTAAAAAAAMAVSATPAAARDYHGDNRDRDGISAGEIIAGVLVIGGIAAIASSAGKRDRYDHDRGGYDRSDYRDYDRRGYARLDPRQAVNQCIRAAERQATRRGRANVTQIRDVDRTRYGYRVRGSIAVGNRSYRDNGRFTCITDGRGRPDIRFKGI